LKSLADLDKVKEKQSLDTILGRFGI